MRLTPDQLDALDPAELRAGYLDGIEGWPIRQGATDAYRWGHDNGMVDGGHQAAPSFNQRELAGHVLARMRSGSDG